MLTVNGIETNNIKLLDDSGFPYGVKHTDNRPHHIPYVWDVDTLSFVPMEQSIVKTDTLNVTANFPGTQAISGTVTAIDENKAQVVYEDGTDLYICKANMGSALGAAVWQIKCIDTADPITTTWCDGDANYDNTATDLATVKGHSYL